NLDFFHWQNEPFIPVEFSAAGYRFGHSMVRFDYQINDVIPVVPIFSDSTNPLVNLNGFRKLPQDWGFDWRFFFKMGPGTPSRLQQAHRIDAKLASPLRTLPRTVAVSPRSLAERNLLRGRSFGLPSGQAVAGAMGISPL